MKGFWTSLECPHALRERRGGTPSTLPLALLMHSIGCIPGQSVLILATNIALYPNLRGRHQGATECHHCQCLSFLRWSHQGCYCYHVWARAITVQASDTQLMSASSLRPLFYRVSKILFQPQLFQSGRTYVHAWETNHILDYFT